MDITDIRYTDGMKDSIVIEPSNMTVAWPLNNEEVRPDVEAWLNTGGTIQEPRVVGLPPVPRKAEIINRLDRIDVESVRPLRAIAEGTAIQADRDKLTSLEAEAASLRAELATL